MMSIFDGLSSLVATTFGDEVSYLAQGSAIPRKIRSIFREAPVEAFGQDGHPVLIVAPTWRVQPSLVPGLARGDRIFPSNGATYAVLTVHPTGSPASDAAVICELEKVIA